MISSVAIPFRDVVQQTIGTAKGMPFRRFIGLGAALVSICAYPALFVYFNNIKEAVFSQTFAPIAIFVAAGLAAWLFFGVLSGRMAKGAFVALVFMFVFMNYAQIEAGIRSTFPDWRWWRTAPTFLLLLIGLALALRREVSHPEEDDRFSKIVLAIGGLYLALIVFKGAIGMHALAAAWGTESCPATTQRVPGDDEIQRDDSGRKRPNFYYLIFDGYARQDVLQKYAGYDNAPFLRRLERKGFNVSYSSRSSSFFTEVSVGNYLHYSHRYNTKMETLGGIPRPPLLEIFKKAGYVTHSLSPVHQFDDDLVDVVLKSTTVLTAKSIAKTVLAQSFVAYIRRDNAEQLRKERLSLLRQVGDLANQRTDPPKFLFFHLMCPHEPFVFDETGGPVSPENRYNWADLRYYAGQLHFLSRKIDELTDEIIEQDPHGVVLLQSDHSFRSEVSGVERDEMTFCFNNLYLGGQPVEMAGLSAINTLRTALNYALGLTLEMEKDWP